MDLAAVARTGILQRCRSATRTEIVSDEGCPEKLLPKFMVTSWSRAARFHNEASLPQ